MQAQDHQIHFSRWPKDFYALGERLDFTFPVLKGSYHPHYALCTVVKPLPQPTSSYTMGKPLPPLTIPCHKEAIPTYAALSALTGTWAVGRLAGKNNPEKRTSPQVHLCPAKGHDQCGPATWTGDVCSSTSGAPPGGWQRYL